MPFTPAHAALVLPMLRSRKFSATALIIGSMAPDFEYFFKFQVSSTMSHTLWGILYFDIPVVIVLALVFHLLVKENLIDSLPVFFQQRLQDLRNLDFEDYLKNNYFIFIISAAIGTATHIFWDAFTHANGFFVRELPFYDGTVVPFQGARYPLYYALQHLSTIVGLTLVIFYFIRQTPVNVASSAAVVSVKYWLVILIITAAVVVIRFSIYADDYIIGNLVVTAITGFCIAVVTAGFFNFSKRPA